MNRTSTLSSPQQEEIQQGIGINNVPNEASTGVVVDPNQSIAQKRYVIDYCILSIIYSFFNAIYNIYKKYFFHCKCENVSPQKLSNEISTSNHTNRTNSRTLSLMNTNQGAEKNNDDVNVQAPKTDSHMSAVGDIKGKSSGTTLPLCEQMSANKRYHFSFDMTIKL